MAKLDVVSDERGNATGARYAGRSGLTFDDPFYDATSEDPDSFEHGDERRGTIKATRVSTSGGHSSWQIRVESADGASRIDAEGQLTNHSDGRPGSGSLTVSKATGEWVGARRLNVAARNPRRWKST